MSSIIVGSIVSGRDKRPYVTVHRDAEQLAQLTPAEAREIAAHILDAACAAEGDAFLVEFLRTTIGVSDEQAVRILPEFRAYRTRENSRPVEIEKIERAPKPGEH